MTGLKSFDGFYVRGCLTHETLEELQNIRFDPDRARAQIIVCMTLAQDKEKFKT